MVRTRVFFGALLIIAVVGLVALDAWLTDQIVPDWPWLAGSLAGGVLCDFLFKGAVLTGVLAIVVTWGVLEMGRLLRAAGHQPAVGWSCLAVFVLMGLPWLSITPALGDRSAAGEWQATGQWLAIAVFVGVVWVLARGRTEGAISGMASTTWLIVYLGFLGSFVTRLRMGIPGPAGAWLVLYFIAVVKFSDIGAYFTGISIGRHRIVPKISPNKTLEGFVGGLAASVVVAVVLARLGGIIMPWYGKSAAGWLLPMGRAAVFGLSVGLVGQVGDLIESMIKRDAQIKDSGALVPTFGGVLDLIDSPLLAAPLAWWLLTGWLG